MPQHTEPDVAPAAMRTPWRVHLVVAAGLLLLLNSGLASWNERHQLAAESELHQTWLPLVEAAGDLISDLDAWQEDPAPLRAERVDARMRLIRQLVESSRGLGGETSALHSLDEAQGLWQDLKSGRSHALGDLHAQVRKLGMTGLMQSQRLANLASGRGA